MSTNECSVQELLDVYRDILDRFAIPTHHREPFVRLVGFNQSDAESDFARELDSNKLYQQAVDEGLYQKFASVRKLFQLALSVDLPL